MIFCNIFYLPVLRCGGHICFSFFFNTFSPLGFIHTAVLRLCEENAVVRGYAAGVAYSTCTDLRSEVHYLRSEYMSVWVL